MSANASVLRRYTFKLYPNKTQEARLVEVSRMCAQLWNALLQMREDAYRRKGRTISKIEQFRDITALRNDPECGPEWSAIPVSLARGVAVSLDEAFQAFFRRAKGGAGASSGYPRYRRVADAGGFRFSDSGGWSFAAAGNRFALYVKGIGTIKARGSVPGAPLSFKTPTVMFRDCVWAVSVVVEMEPRRQRGHEDIKVAFDLIDQFARVERENGAVPALRESANQNHFQRDNPAAGAGCPEMGSDGNHRVASTVSGRGAGCPEMGSDGNIDPEVEPGVWGAGCPEMGLDGNSRWAACSLAMGAGCPEISSELHRAKALTEREDKIKSERDMRRKRRSWRWRKETEQAGRLTAKAARIRKDALHRWSTEVTRTAARLTVTAPAVKENTKSARGKERNHGAAVEINAALNRNTLNQAPATAIQMLSYKAAEAAIPFALIEDEAPVVSIGQGLSKATKAARRARRTIKDEAA